MKWSESTMVHVNDSLACPRAVGAIGANVTTGSTRLRVPVRNSAPTPL